MKTQRQSGFSGPFQLKAATQRASRVSRDVGKAWTKWRPVKGRQKALKRNERWTNERWVARRHTDVSTWWVCKKFLCKRGADRLYVRKELHFASRHEHQQLSTLQRLREIRLCTASAEFTLQTRRESFVPAVFIHLIPEGFLNNKKQSHLALKQRELQCVWLFSSRFYIFLK